MKNKIKKIITATVVSAMSLTALGVGVNSQNCDKKDEKIVQNYTISKDIEKTSALVPNKNIGKIVETSTDNQIKYLSNGKQIQFLNNDITEAEIENNITLPQRIDGLNMFVLSSTPFVSFTNDNNELKINVKFSQLNTTETESTLNSTDKEKLNTYNLKRSILMIYANEIYNNNITLSNENKIEINSHIETISNTKDDESSSNLDNKISAINSIITIIETNLTPNSMFYQRAINSNIDNLATNNQSVDKITETSSNQDIANKIACVLNGKCSSSNLQNNEIVSNQIQQRNVEYTNKNNSIQTNNANQLTGETVTENRTNPLNNNLTNQNAYRRNNLRNRRRNNRINQNNINSNANEIMEERINNQNNTTNNTFRNGTIMQDSKTMRADRTNENISQEKYTNVTNTQNELNRASRVPYQSTNNFQR